MEFFPLKGTLVLACYGTFFFYYNLFFLLPFGHSFLQFGLVPHCVAEDDLELQIPPLP